MHLLFLSNAKSDANDEGETLMKGIILALTVVGLLTGCSAAEREAWGHPDPEADDAKCKSFGLKPGTEQYMQCRLYAEQQRAETQRRNLAASAQLGALGSGLMAQGAPRPVSSSPMPSWYRPTTNCRMIGQMATCQTY